MWDRASAFEERDVAALTRLSEMAVTAVEHAEAAQRTLPGISEAERAEALPAEEPDVVEAVNTAPVEELPRPTAEPDASILAEIARIGSCQACGFPVSQAERYAWIVSRQDDPPEPNPLLRLGQEESWFEAHGYTIGTLVIAALTLALLALKLR